MKRPNTTYHSMYQQNKAARTGRPRYPEIIIHLTGHNGASHNAKQVEKEIIGKLQNEGASSEEIGNFQYEVSIALNWVDFMAVVSDWVQVH